MPESKSYTQLEVWKKSRELVKDVYMLTNAFPKEELYSLTNQIRRAIVSIPSNIAEGIGRNSYKETIQYLYIAKGSIYEVETQLYLAYDLHYINLGQLEEMLLKVEECRKLLYGFIQYYRKKSE